MSQKFKTIVFDTLTQFQSLLVKELHAEKVEKDKRLKTKQPGDWGTMTKQDWGSIAGDMKALIQDARNLPQEWIDKYPNSAYIWNQQQFDSIDPASTDHLLGLFQSEHMQYEADRAEDTGGEPSLAQMTRLAIEILSRNSQGYFLLVEGGRIDHGHHDNNAYRALTDGIAFADAVAVADEMTDLNDTLIIVTADHSHTFNFSGYPERGNPILGKVASSDSEGNLGGKLKLMDDEKPFTTVGYYVGPGAAWVGGPRPDISEVDTVNDKNYIQQAAIPAEDDAHGG